MKKNLYIVFFYVLIIGLFVIGGSYYLKFDNRENDFISAEELETDYKEGQSEEKGVYGHSIGQRSENKILKTDIGGPAPISLRADREFSIDQTISVPEGETVVGVTLHLPRTFFGQYPVHVEIMNVKIGDHSVEFTDQPEDGYINVKVEGEWSNTEEVITYTAKITDTKETGILGVAVGSIQSLEGNVSTDTRIVQIVSIPVNSITLDPSTITFEMDESRQLSAEITPDNATDKNVFWSSSNNKIATVDEQGLVTAVGPGTAIITVTTNDGGLTATSKVTIAEPHEPVTGVQLAPESVEISVGERVKLQETVLPTNASNKNVSWKSSDISVAFFDIKEGSVVGLKPGETTITVETEDGGFTASTIVTVLEEGTLAFSESLDVLNFQDIILSKEDVLAKRISEGPLVTVLDTRVAKESYSIQVSLEEPLSSLDDSVLPSALIFLNSLGESQTLSSQSIEIYHHQPVFHQSSEFEKFELEWEPDEGILLNMTSKEMIPGSYSGLLNWSIVSGP